MDDGRDCGNGTRVPERTGAILCCNVRLEKRMKKPNHSRKSFWRCALLIMPLGLGMLAAASLPPGLSSYDSNKDGVLNLDEAKAAASAMFDKLDTDHDGTLTLMELKGRVSETEFSAADRKGDKKLTKEEYLDLVAKAFKAGDVDNDDVLDAGDLKSKPGQAFLKLVM
jgi:Ca2+-binding EF-hand superfamily protein